MTESEFVVVGTEPNPGGAPLALLARNGEDGLTYAGSAFVTLARPERDLFWARAADLAVSKAAFKELRGRKAAFTRPALRVRARHLRGGGTLRHAALIGVLG